MRLFHEHEALKNYVESDAFEDSVDGITLIQEYIRAPEPFVTRVEFVGGEYLYAVRVDTSLGFELCPADVYQVGDAFCPVGETAPVSPSARFRILPGFDHGIVQHYRRFIADNGIGIAGIEFITDAAGRDLYVRRQHEHELQRGRGSRSGIYGMRAIARYLGASCVRSPPRAAVVRGWSSPRELSESRPQPAVSP